jgi:hypothetical protein
VQARQIRLVALFKLCLIPLIGWTLSIAAARAIGARVDWPGVAACILGILAAYRLDAVLDRRVGLFAEEVRPDLLIIAIAGAALLGIAAAQPRLLLPLMILGGLGVFYIPLKRFIPKNLLTASAWAICVVTLSLQIDSWSWLPVATTLAIFFLVLSNASLCDLPDIAIDRENRVLGVVALLGPGGGGRVAALIALISLMLAITIRSAAFALPAAIFIAVGLLFSQRVAADRSRRWLLDAVLILPGPISLVAPS